MESERAREIKIEGNPTRCPYCHDEVAVLAEEVACEKCLARHHETCWRDAGRCATCGHSTRLVHEGARPAPMVTEEDARNELREDDRIPTALEIAERRLAQQNIERAERVEAQVRYASRVILTVIALVIVIAVVAVFGLAKGP